MWSGAEPPCVPDNATLDEFAGGSGAADDEEGESTADDRAEPDGENVEADGESVDSDGESEQERASPDGDDGATAGRGGESVAPAVSTYRWQPDGVACADCGETVRRLWRDGDDLVCDGCKDWTA